MMTDTPENVSLVPIARIEVLNSRDRNMKVFEEIVESIQLIGLKKPITVAERAGEDGQPKYVLVCGEGRLNAFRILGETHIPALVVDVSDEDAFIMSLAENIARRGYRPLEILADIELLRERGYTADVIIQKTGLSPKYVRDIVFLLEQGEERLIEGVQRGSIPLTTALEIARASANDPQNTNGEGGESNLGGATQHPSVFLAHGQVPLGEAAERMSAPVGLMRQHPKLELVFSGGEGRLLATGTTEAELARAFYEEQGVDMTRVTLEDGSRNTRENAQQVAKWLGSRCQQPWLLVTSAWHMPRSMAEFEAVGCKVTAYPVDFRTGDSTSLTEYSMAQSLLYWQTALHEWLGLLVYGVTR